MYYQTHLATPCAHITKKKQRLRQNQDKVYLSNNEEFEIEIFNPTNLSILAKIKINGNYISSGGLVLKPGQRIFLERFLDDSRKFKFETYSVDGSSKEVQKAIEKNGDVEIEFYNEKIPYIHNIYFPNTTVWGGTLTTNTGGLHLTGNIGTTTSTNISSSYNSSSDTLSFSQPTKRKKETGTIERGSSSNQSFGYSNKVFENYYSFRSYWKILPISEKIHTSKDLKKYCSECGATIKKPTWKFCPACGEDLQN